MKKKFILSACSRWRPNKIIGKIKEKKEIYHRWVYNTLNLCFNPEHSKHRFLAAEKLEPPNRKLKSFLAE